MMRVIFVAVFVATTWAIPLISQQGCISDPADIIFLLDSSGSIENQNFKKELQFIAEFAKHYVIGPNNVQIGIVSYSSFIFDNFQMNTHKNINNLEAAITGIHHAGHRTHTGEALQYVRMNSFTHQRGDRSNVPNFLIVITDGHSNGQASVSAQANIIHNFTNIETFAIGVGPNISKGELDVIASSPNHVLLVSDHLNLHIPLHEIHCDSKTTVTTTKGFNPCYPNPCNNGGTCVPFATIFYCRCVQGYKGTTCTTRDNNTSSPTIWRPITPSGKLTTSWFHIGSGTPSGSSSKTCQDSSLFSCTTSVCKTADLAKYCPVTCGSCVPCEDSKLFACNQAVCSEPALKAYCPLTCGACGGGQ